MTISAPPEAVWPWLAQIGQGRGGLYSYDGLEKPRRVRLVEPIAFVMERRMLLGLADRAGRPG